MECNSKSVVLGRVVLELCGCACDSGEISEVVGVDGIECSCTGSEGQQGQDGKNGKSPYIGENGNWYTWDDEEQRFIDTGIKAQGAEGTIGGTGVDGAKGDPGVGVPAGGAAGQVLTKRSDEDYDTEWTNQTCGTGGDNSGINNGSGVIEIRTEFYVSPNGSDITGDGTQAKPWKTIQYSVDEIAKLPKANGTVATLYISDGTYKESIQLSNIFLALVGNISNPANVRIGDGSGGNLMTVVNMSNVQLSGIQFDNVVSSGSLTYSVYAVQSRCYINSCIFNASVDTVNDIRANCGSFVDLSDNNTFVGDKRKVMLQSNHASHIYIVGSNKIANSMTFVNAMVVLTRLGCLSFSSVAAGINLVAASGIKLTGKSYDVSALGRLSGIASIPTTTVAGTIDTSTGGQAI